MKPGDRVGAICSMDNATVRLFGYGVYEGDYPRPENSPGVFGTVAEMRKSAEEVFGKPEIGWNDEEKSAFDRMISNPRIRLDSGDVVWGCQCWWGPEENVRQQIGQRTVEIVPVPAEG